MNNIQQQLENSVRFGDNVRRTAARNERERILKALPGIVDDATDYQWSEEANDEVPFVDTDKLISLLKKTIKNGQE